MFFSVIIPTCNRNDLLSKCLSCLAPSNQTIDSSTYEVIVTDDSEENRANPLIEENYAWAKWIEGPKRGPAANRNNGAKNATGEWLIFIDDDCLPIQDCLAAYLKATNKGSCTVIEGKTIADRPKQRFDEEAPINEDGNKLWSCNFAIQKKTFEKVKGFDETFPYAAMEDIDFYVRILKDNSIEFVPQALVIHPWRRIKICFTLKKHLQSHRHYKAIHINNRYTDFRLKRIKIFLWDIFFGFKELSKFSFRGWKYYLGKIWLNFCLIFI